MPCRLSAIAALHGQTFSGDYLMRVDVLVSAGNAPALTSHVLELTAE